MMAFSPGVWFGLPAEDYFSVPALSASGVKLLRQSPLDYWARTAWLNPNVEVEEDSFAYILGAAYHARLLEGREVFDRRFAAKFEATEDHLVTDDDLKEWMVSRGYKPSGSRKANRIATILELEPSMKDAIYDLALEAYRQEHHGKKFLSQNVIDRIELAAAMIEKSPTLGQAFKGGIPEVSIFWVDEETGCPCKARLDYWKPRATVDLKTFENQYGREISRAVDREFANNRYAFQATQYIQAVDAAIKLMKDGKIYGSAPLAITDAIIKAPADERKFFFIFQQKGPAPVACGKVFNRQSALFQICAAHLETARRTYVEYMAKFGTDLWITDMPITEIQDDEVAPWATE
jgi:hypothetical protein